MGSAATGANVKCTDPSDPNTVVPNPTSKTNPTSSTNDHFQAVVVGMKRRLGQ